MSPVAVIVVPVAPTFRAPSVVAGFESMNRSLVVVGNVEMVT